ARPVYSPGYEGMRVPFTECESGQTRLLLGQVIPASKFDTKPRNALTKIGRSTGGLNGQTCGSGGHVRGRARRGKPRRQPDELKRLITSGAVDPQFGGVAGDPAIGFAFVGQLVDLDKRGVA